ncbi:beta-lactamase-like protein [Fusarium tricinctum]|uniref:Beta-lactamase-like protein n=1 Tax=Fusarium tricinctum TaxID=61284 RepID=A0A8K0WF19_9HYPO|nr:beta-lactamase-like protein [Fusarium tricinctum]
MVKNFVSVHALSGGHLTLPERFFVTPLDDSSARKTVPSLSFLIQHKDPENNKITRIVFDLGIRRVSEDYAEPIYKHAQTRQPISGDPGTVKSLEGGGLTPDDIDMVVFSHLHWDHIGTPSDYPKSTYVVGPGAKSLIDGTQSSAIGSHNHFETGILDLSRTIELPPTDLPATPPPFEKQIMLSTRAQQLVSRLSQPWHRMGFFESVIDIFNDGSVYVVSAPGHINGHVNLLCRLEDGRHVYLAGDACHDQRLLSGEKDIATWSDDALPHVVCCIHQNKAEAERTLRAIRNSMKDPGDLGQLEVIFAHDWAWEERARKENLFFPGSI